MPQACNQQIQTRQMIPAKPQADAMCRPGVRGPRQIGTATRGPHPGTKGCERAQQVKRAVEGVRCSVKLAVADASHLHLPHRVQTLISKGLGFLFKPGTTAGNHEGNIRQTHIEGRPTKHLSDTPQTSSKPLRASKTRQV